MFLLEVGLFVLSFHPIFEKRQKYVIYLLYFSCNHSMFKQIPKGIELMSNDKAEFNKLIHELTRIVTSDTINDILNDQINDIQD